MWNYKHGASRRAWMIIYIAKMFCVSLSELKYSKVVVVIQIFIYRLLQNSYVSEIFKITWYRLCSDCSEEEEGFVGCS